MSDEIRDSEKRNFVKTKSGATALVAQRGLSLDSWAVLLALAAAALVKLHILNTVKW
jgi:hypothetical protein